MARSVYQTRDNQRSKVYAWERQAFPNYFSLRTSPKDADFWIRKSHYEAINGGAYFTCPPNRVVVNFDQVKGRAKARYGELWFDPNYMPFHYILHEVAHSLTGKVGSPQFDSQGHGGKFTACFIVLCEKYCGDNAVNAIRKANWFQMETETRTERTRYDGLGKLIKVVDVKKVTKAANVDVDREAFQYWRKVFFK